MMMATPAKRVSTSPETSEKIARPGVGDRVKIIAGRFLGQYGKIERDDKDHLPYRVMTDAGHMTEYLTEKHVATFSEAARRPGIGDKVKIIDGIFLGQSGKTVRDDKDHMPYKAMTDAGHLTGYLPERHVARMIEGSAAALVGKVVKYHSGCQWRRAQVLSADEQGRLKLKRLEHPFGNRSELVKFDKVKVKVCKAVIKNTPRYTGRHVASQLRGSYNWGNRFVSGTKCRGCYQERRAGRHWTETTTEYVEEWI